MFKLMSKLNVVNRMMWKFLLRTFRAKVLRKVQVLTCPAPKKRKMPTEDAGFIAWFSGNPS